MLKKINLLNNFIALIPFSIILGNLAININVLIICILGVITYGKKVFIIDNKLYQYLILSFFFYLILLTLIKNLPNLSLNELFKINIIKSILFLRFLILFFVVYKLIENKEFNLKIFFISCAFFSAFLALDIVIQVLFKKDLLGNEIIYNRASGFFGSEAVAGGYIQKFSFFFYFSLCFKN